MLCKESASKSDGWQKSWFKIWYCLKFLLKIVFFSQKRVSQNEAFQDSTKVPTLLFLQLKAIQKTWFFTANFQMIFDFSQSFCRQILTVDKILIQNLILSKVFESKNIFVPKTSLSESNFPRQHEKTHCSFYSLRRSKKLIL